MNKREKFCLWLFKVSDRPYAFCFKPKRKAWDLKLEDLGNFPEKSWGRELYNFLKSNGFSLLPKLERHDAYHVFLNIETEVKDEIGMQYFLLGNGKRTPYLFFTILMGTILVPDHRKYYMDLFKKGKSKPQLYDLNVLLYLNEPLSLVQEKYKIQ